MPFEKGNKVGAKGRPPAGKAMTERLRMYLARPNPYDADKATYHEGVIKKLVERALAGEVPAIKEIFDRCDGKAPQAIEMAQNADKPFRIVIEHIGSR